MRLTLAVAFALLALTGPAQARPRLKVITYNIHFGAGPGAAVMAPGPRWVDEIAELIRIQNPDVVGLQEVMAGGVQSAFVNERARLAEKTGYRIYYKEAQYKYGVSSGIALLTKHPVLAEKLVELMPEGDHQITGSTETEAGIDHAERRLAQAALIAVPGWEPLWFVNTHFHSGRPENRQPNYDVLENQLIASLSGPIVLMGDFNSRTPKGDRGHETAYGQSILKSADGSPFVDALVAVGKTDPVTFPSPTDRFRLDWLYTTPQLWVESAFVTGWETSDHEAIVAELRDRADVFAAGPPGSAPLSLLGVR